MEVGYPGHLQGRRRTNRTANLWTFPLGNGQKKLVAKPTLTCASGLPERHLSIGGQASFVWWREKREFRTAQIAPDSD